MAKQSVFSKIINWVAPGFNKPAPVRRSPNDPNESGPSGSRASVSDQIQPNQENKGFGLLVDEMNCDYQIKFCNYIVAANVAAVQVSISVENGDGPKSAALQEKLQKLWEKTVASMMPSIGFGRVAFEKGWDYDTKNQLTYVQKLEAMEYQDSRLKLTEDHKYDGFSVKIKDNPETWEPVLRENSWWLAIGATAKNPHGVSHYKGAVEACWRIKRETMKNREVYVRRFAIRGGVAHGPETAIDERNGLPYSCAEKMAESAEAFYSGGMMYLSNEPHHDSRMAEAGKYEWDFSEANATALDPGPLLTVEDKDNVSISRAFGIPEKTGMEGDGVGSYAQLSEQMLTLFALVDSIVAQWIASFQEYVVECSREANYGEGDGPVFTIHAVKLTNRPDSFVITLLTALAANPQFATLLLSGGVDLRSVLEQVGLPVSPEFELIAKQVAARFQAATGGPAGAMPGQPGPTGADPGTSPEGAVPAEFANFSTLQLNRVFSATSKIQNAFIDGTDSESVARIKLTSIGWSPASVDKLIADASDGTIDDPELAAPVAMRNLLTNQKAQFKGFLEDLVKKKSPNV